MRSDWDTRSLLLPSRGGSGLRPPRQDLGAPGRLALGSTHAAGGLKLQARPWGEGSALLEGAILCAVSWKGTRPTVARLRSFSGLDRSRV